MSARTLWPHHCLTRFLQNQRPAPPRLDLAKIAQIKERRSKVRAPPLDPVDEDDDQLLLSPRLTPRQPSPLPPSSPPTSSPVDDQIFESDVDDSADDYGAQQALELRAREKLASRGKELPLRVEDEDEEDEQDFENEIGENGLEDDDETPRRARKSKASKAKPQTKPKSKERKKASEKKKSKNEGKNPEQGDADVDEPPKKRQRKTTKGKGKANVVMTGDDADESAGEGDEVAGGHKTGPMPVAIRKRAQRVFDTFLQDIQDLADECKKPASALHQAVGSSAMRAPRTPSGWNMWQQWHSVEHPKDPESKSRPVSCFLSNLNG